jgi:hypothetical protein
MRLAAIAKGGFYPIHPAALKMCLKDITFAEETEKQKHYILDPCCGEGEAIETIGKMFDVNPLQIYGMEIEEGRAESAKKRLPESRIVGPSSFLGSYVSNSSFNFIWLNPPFDNEMGGGSRVEFTFIRAARQALAPEGIIAICLPESTAWRDDVKRFLFRNFYDISIRVLPDEYRKFGEIVYICRNPSDEEFKTHARMYGGTVRNDIDMNLRYYTDREFNEELMENEYREYLVKPIQRRYFMFSKRELTEAEMVSAIESSTLNQYLKPTFYMPKPRPPMSLGKGHLAILLTAGHLDGIVPPYDGEKAHVVRGTCIKVKYLASATETEDEKGNVTSVEVYAEQIVPVIRVLDSDGDITDIGTQLKNMEEVKDNDINVDAGESDDDD